jgi:hypothetical protein
VLTARGPAVLTALGPAVSGGISVWSLPQSSLLGTPTLGELPDNALCCSVLRNPVMAGKRKRAQLRRGVGPSVVDKRSEDAVLVLHKVRLWSTVALVCAVLACSRRAVVSRGASMQKQARMPAQAHTKASYQATGATERDGGCT